MVTKVEDAEKNKAMIRLMYELNKGRRSGEEEGYVADVKIDKIMTFYEALRGCPWFYGDRWIQMD